MCFPIPPRKIKGITYSLVTVETPHKSIKPIAEIVELVCNHPQCITEETIEGVACRVTIETKISNTITLMFSNPPVFIDEYQVIDGTIELHGRLYEVPEGFVNILDDPEVTSTLSYGRTDQILKLSMYMTIDGWGLSKHTYFDEVPRRLDNYTIVHICGLWYVIHGANVYREHSSHPTNAVEYMAKMVDHVLHTVPGTKDVELFGNAYIPITITFRLVYHEPNTK